MTTNLHQTVAIGAALVAGFVSGSLWLGAALASPVPLLPSDPPESDSNTRTRIVNSRKLNIAAAAFAMLTAGLGAIASLVP